MESCSAFIIPTLCRSLKICQSVKNHGFCSRTLISAKQLEQPTTMLTLIHPELH
jgi:hypothetical protein